MSTTIVKTHYQDQAVASAYDGERFVSFAGRTFDRLEKRALRRPLSVVRRHIGDPVVLDVPCGTGRITELLGDEGFAVTGGDISLEMIDVARDKCARFGDRMSFQRLDLDGLDLPADSYDLVTCIRLFHHLDSPARAKIMGELARVTRRFVLVNHSLSTPYYRLRRRTKRLLGQGVSRESSTWREIRNEAAAGGLEICGTYHVARYLSEDLLVLLEKH